MSNNYAKLIYADEVTLEGVQQIYPSCFINEDRLDRTRNLTKNDCLVVTDPALMRGFDYRCKEGISLLLAQSSNSQRTLSQALGRVGRFDEDCLRYILNGTETINEDARHAVTSRINRRM